MTCLPPGDDVVRSMPETVPRVLIVDSYCSANRGDAAILTGLIQSLREELGCVKFKVHSNYPHVTESMHGVQAAFPLFGRLLLKRSVTFCLEVIVFFTLAILYQRGIDLNHLLPRRNRESFTDFYWADLVIGMGGTFYNDIASASLPGRLLHLYMAKVLGKPVAISAHSFGPFKRPWYRLLARVILNRVDLICTRDIESLRILKELRVNAPRIERTADSAWLLASVDAKRGADILRAEGIVESRPLISLSARKWWYYELVDSQEGHTRYIATLAKVADNLVMYTGANLVFASTCTDLGGHRTDDRLVGDEIRACMKYRTGMAILRGEYTPEELAAVYGQMDLHIGTRMHSNILAALMGIPIVAIAYEFKTYGLMASLGLSDYVCDINDTEDSELQAKVLSALEHREELRRRILENLPTLKHLAQLNAHLIAQLLTLKHALPKHEAEVEKNER
jgi:colanic acid/amylovoran biosynthesis protein